MCSYYSSSSFAIGVCGFVPRFLRLLLIWVWRKVSTHIFVGLFLIWSGDLGMEKGFAL